MCNHYGYPFCTCVESCKKKGGLAADRKILMMARDVQKSIKTKRLKNGEKFRREGGRMLGTILIEKSLNEI
jgi:hypothetical protein